MSEEVVAVEPLGASTEGQAAENDIEAILGDMNVCPAEADSVRTAMREILVAKEATRTVRSASGTATITFGTCGMRRGGRYARRTAGAVWMMTSDGVLFPPLELADAESTRMVLLSIIKTFQGRPYPRGSKGAIAFVFDDMCHLLRYAPLRLQRMHPIMCCGMLNLRAKRALCRYAMKRRGKHPEIERFCSSAVHAVDKWHFVKNHIGRWCHLFVNPSKVRAYIWFWFGEGVPPRLFWTFPCSAAHAYPYRAQRTCDILSQVPALEKANTEVCEQRFRHINR